MRRRSEETGGAGASDTAHTEDSPPGPADIFEGVKRLPIHSQSPASRALDDSKKGNSGRTLVSSAPQATGQSELLLNRLLAKHPRFFWYAAIAVVGIIIGILLGKKL